jgi:glutamyl-tRNA reductase
MGWFKEVFCTSYGDRLNEIDRQHRVRAAEISRDNAIINNHKRCIEDIRLQNLIEDLRREDKEIREASIPKLMAMLDNPERTKEEKIRANYLLGKCIDNK